MGGGLCDLSIWSFFLKHSSNKISYRLENKKPATSAFLIKVILSQGVLENVPAL